MRQTDQDMDRRVLALGLPPNPLPRWLGPLGERFWLLAQLLGALSLPAAQWREARRTLLWRLLLAAAYAWLPADLLPDVPVVGWIDDWWVLGWAAATPVPPAVRRAGALKASARLRGVLNSSRWRALLWLVVAVLVALSAALVALLIAAARQWTSLSAT